MGAGEGPHSCAVETLATKVARSYQRRVFWAELDDLKQEAALAALRAERTYDPQCGVPFDGYAWRACVLALRRWCWKASAPVAEADHKLHTLRGVYGMELTDYDSGADTHAMLEEKDWVERVREQVDYLLDKLGGDAGVAARVIVLEDEPAEVARQLGLPVASVYRIVRRGRALLTNNALLYDLWRES